MPVKYQPDLIYLRHVKTKRIHLFTLVQTICFAVIMIVKEITVTSLAFPLTVSISYTWFPSLRCRSRIRFRIRFRKNRVRTYRTYAVAGGACARQ